jgi:hypothetical protein
VRPLHEHLAYRISDNQLAEIRTSLEDIEPTIIPLGRTPRYRHPPGAYPLFYAFIRDQPLPFRVYGGLSCSPFGRIRDQKTRFKWATAVITFELRGYLVPEILSILEKRLLRHGYATLPGAIWHNERGLSARLPDPFSVWGIYSELDDLTHAIMSDIASLLPKSATIPLEQPKMTHILGGPEKEVYGRMAQIGRRTMLLKGSRVSSLAPNITTLEKIGGFSWRRGSPLWFEGRMEKRPATMTRPAGLCLSEPAPFPTPEDAARFLTLDQPDRWVWRNA